MRWTCTHYVLALFLAVNLYASTEGVLSGREIAQLSSTEAIDLLCSRKLTAVQYVTALLGRAETFGCINSYAYLAPEKVLADARAVDEAAAAGKDVKPLCGLAFAVKDNLDVLGYPTSAGTPALDGMMPGNNSALVTRLLEAHGVVLGKMRMHELAYGGTSINVHGGPVLNPYNNTMHVGGSSGGTCAAVAMRMAPAGFCSDTGGSCRIPASITGVIGFRPTTGCWNAADGIVPMTTTRDTVGVNARSMADIKLFNTLFSDCSSAYSSVAVKGLRVGYPRNFWEDVGEESLGVLQAALAAMEEAGVILVPMDMGLVIDLGNKELPNPLFTTFEMARELSRYLYTHGYNISLVHLVDSIATPAVKKIMREFTTRKLDTYPTPADYAHAVSVSMPKLKKLWASYHEAYDVDVVVVPTLPTTARPIDDAQPYFTHNGRKVEDYEIYGRAVKIDCVLSIPSVSLPAGLATDGMPIGIMFYARPGDDATLLSIAEAVEPLIAPTPPPPEVAQCAGCRPAVKVVEVTWDGKGQPAENDTTSCYELVLHGECALKSELQNKVSYESRSEL